MVQALRDRGREPVQEICKWNDSLPVREDPAPLGDDDKYEPTPEKPVVFHLHGRLGIPESMVLTEDDYLEFLVTLAERSEPDQYLALLPHQVARALSSTSLIFIGYGLKDWDFRVIHRGLVIRGNAALRRMSVTVQLEGLNSRIRLISHRSFGFHSAAPLIALVYLCCSGIAIDLPR